MKKIIYALSLALALQGALAQAQSLRPMLQQKQQMQDVKELTEKFHYFLYYLTMAYVDTINPANLTENAITKMLSELDPHSSYTSAKDAKNTTEQLLGNFDGIGIEFNVFVDTLLVIAPISGGPSQKVGIVAGDRIVEVDSTNIAGVGMKTTDMMKLLRGPKGTVVNLKVLRRAEPQLLDFTIIRDKIPLFSIDATFWAAPGIAYIRLGRFAGTSHAEFLEALKKLGKHPDGIILDLRGNSGGMLDVSTLLADEFLPPGKLMLYTEGRALPRMNSVSTDTLSAYEQGNVVVLIDEHSASASEILAGAIQDWDRGIIVGRRSFGKGMVQNQIELPDGSLVRITIARYHTPTGRVIQRPYDNGKADKYYHDLYQRYNNGEMYHADSLKNYMPDTLLRFQTLQNHRTVYGGGGIMPDVFVPLDTSSYTPYHAKLVRSGIIYQYTLDYLEKHRSELKKFKNLKQFSRDFDVSQPMLDELVAFAEAKKLPRNDSEITRSSREITVQVKGLLAQDLFGSSAYYEIVYPSIDEGYKRAVEIMTSWKDYEKLLK
jgi:carboxyl-terminal processing protease